MAGPQPQAQPPVPPAPPPPPQGGYPQPQKKSGMMKGCIIAAIIVGVLGVLTIGSCVACVYIATDMVGDETEAGKMVAEDFLGKLSDGDIDGAHALCDSSSISRSSLEEYFLRHEAVLRGNTGITFDVQTMGMWGTMAKMNETTTVVLFPAHLNNATGVQTAFQLRRTGENPYRIIVFEVTGDNPVDPASGTTPGEDPPE